MRQQLEQLKHAREQYRAAQRDKNSASKAYQLAQAVYELELERAQERRGELVAKPKPRFWKMFKGNTAKRNWEEHRASRLERMKEATIREGLYQQVKEATIRQKELGQQVAKLTPRFFRVNGGNARGYKSMFPRKDAINHIPLVRYVPSTSNSHNEDALYTLHRYVERQETVRSDIELDLPDAHIESHRAACYLCQEDFQKTTSPDSFSSAYAAENPNADEEALGMLRLLPYADDTETFDALRQLPCSHVFHVSSVFFMGIIPKISLSLVHRNPALIHGCSRNQHTAPRVGG
jgi:hypothetical protein